MQKSISKAAVTWRLVLSVLIIGSFISCEDTNTVGSGIVDSTDISIDTLYVTNFEQNDITIYSGDLTNPPLGRYEDQIFGSYESIGYAKPRLIPQADIPISDSSKLKLMLQFDGDTFYGDTTATTNFSIYRVTERWRESTILADDVIDFDNTELVGSFSYLDQDSIIIDLSDSVSAEYIRYSNNEDDDRDSLYNFEFFGLAIVPDAASSKIIFPTINTSQFFSVEETSLDTTFIPINDYAFTTKRENEPTFNNRLYLSSNLESFYKVSFQEIASTIGSKNVLNAQLYLYEDTLLIKNSLPLNHIRPTVNFMDLKFFDGQEFRFDLQFSSPDFFAERDSTGRIFRFNITEHINEYIFGNVDDQELYLSINPNGGLLYSSILYDSSSSQALKPKIVLTIAE
jgi:hypothetical protein